MRADRTESASAQLTELRDALRELASRIEPDPAQFTNNSASLLSDALLRVAGVSSEILSLWDSYASLTMRVAALEDGAIKGLATQQDTISMQGPQPNNDSTVLSLTKRLLSGLTSRSPKFQIHALWKELAARTEKINKLLNERDTLMQRMQSLERQSAVSANYNRNTHEALAFPKVVLDTVGLPEVIVVDVGAQNLDSEGHVYEPLVRTKVAKIVGFEPLQDEASKRKASEPSTAILGHFVGKGGPAQFYVTRFNPASSLYEPNVELVSRFFSLATMCEKVETMEVATVRLDDIEQIEDCDFLKIDVQGGEADVIEGGARLLDRTITVHTEVEFAPVYKGQPLFSDIDVLLRNQGFELIDLVCPGYNTYAAMLRPLSRSRLLWADAIYFKRPEQLALVDPSKLIKAAYIAHVNYGMYDLAADYLQHYDDYSGTKLTECYNWALYGP